MSERNGKSWIKIEKLGKTDQRYFYSNSFKNWKEGYEEEIRIMGRDRQS